VAGGWRRLHNEELHNLYALANIIIVIKSRRMRWAGHVAHMGDVRNTKCSSQNLKGRDHAEDLGVDGRIILERIMENRVGEYGLDSSGSGCGPVAGCCEHGNEPSGSVKGREFLD
jgi:hypothetical protein